MSFALSVDGALLAPLARTDGQATYRLQLPVREVRLLSGSARPVDRQINSDDRWLGVRLAGMRFQQDAMLLEVPISAGEFVDGFYYLEGDNFRWTNGNAVLPISRFPPWTGEILLHLDLWDWPGSEQPSVTADHPAELMNAFESLGSDCELAFAQRHFRATKPAGLLAWAATDPARLIAGLEQEFSGVGDPAATEILWSSGEYKLRTRYFQTHTGYHKQGGADVTAAVMQASCARLRLLRRKLLADIAAAQRIFVFKHRGQEMPVTEMQSLHTALRRIGPATLLCVMLPTPQHPAGMVERAADGLYVGRLSRFVLEQGPYDEWLTVCGRTLTLHQPRH